MEKIMLKLGNISNIKTEIKYVISCGYWCVTDQFMSYMNIRKSSWV